MGTLAADTAVVGHHRAILKTNPIEDADIGVVHLLIGLEQGIEIDIEGIGVLHDEFPRPHDAESGSDLVAELGLDLVEIDRELAVTADLVPGDLRDHLLVGGAETEIAIVPVFDAQQLRPVLFPAAGGLPKLCRMNPGHQHLLGAGTIHLFPDDGLDLVQYPLAHGKPAIDSGCGAADQAGAQHQLMADDFGVGGNFFQGGEEAL